MPNNYMRPRGRRDPEPTDLATAKQAAATAAAMTQKPRPSDRHAGLLAALRTRLGLAADAGESTILAAIEKANATAEERRLYARIVAATGNPEAAHPTAREEAIMSAEDRHLYDRIVAATGGRATAHR